MKIVAINGSHRGEKGFTQFLINKLFEGAVKSGAFCETIVLANKKINTCLGCLVCQSEKSYLKCVYNDKDDVAEIFTKMRKADLIIYATPIYIFNMSGLLKIFLDRITSTADCSIHTVSNTGLFFHHIDKQLCSKPFVLLTCQDNYENETCKNVENYFKTFSRFLEAPLVGILSSKSGLAIGHGKSKEKESHFPKIFKVYDAYIKAGEELVTYGEISKKTQICANQNIVEMPGIIEFLLKFRFMRKNRSFMKMLLEKSKLSIG
jgi:putative NADPH-quinone reductase